MLQDALNKTGLEGYIDGAMSQDALNKTTKRGQENSLHCNEDWNMAETS
jgi:hypothetical protein